MAPDFTLVQAVLSGRWTLKVLSAAAQGGRFGDLQGQLCPIARGTLSKELQSLEALELLHRTAYAEFPPRVEYHLTAKGQTLLRILRPLISDPSGGSAGASPVPPPPHW